MQCARLSPGPRDVRTEQRQCVLRAGTVEEAPLPPSGKSSRDANVPESEIHSFPSTFSSVSLFIQHTLKERLLIHPLLGWQPHPGSGRLWGWTAAPTCTQP